MRILKLIKRYKCIINYLFFGICTTIVNILMYAICTRLFAFGLAYSTYIAWVSAVLFAYITNRRWVFKSSTKEFKQVIKECLAFFACRISTGVLDILIMFVFVNRYDYNDIIIKGLSNIIVIIVNYIASKFIIFKKR